MNTKKYLIGLAALALSSTLCLQGQALANSPKDYQGASASNSSFMAEGRVSYDGNIVSLPVKLDNIKDKNFIFKDENDLYFVVSAPNQTEATATISKIDKDTYNLSFDISQLELDTEYNLHVYTKNTFASIDEPGDITFKWQDRTVTFSGSHVTVTKIQASKEQVSKLESEKKDVESAKKEDTTLGEQVTKNDVNTIKEDTTSTTTATVKHRLQNTTKKVLPQTSAIK